MKDEDLIAGYVVDADQQHSRKSTDEVPAALRALQAIGGFELPWERTAGDEIQGFSTDPLAVVSAIVQLARLGDWQVGIGIGTVEAPLPSSTRAARGSAYLHAREAIDAAKRAPTASAIRGASSPHAEAALWLLLAVLERRTPEGWQVADLLATGQTQSEIATTLAISQSAVSQRVARSAIEIASAGTDLVASLLATELQNLSLAEARVG